MCHRTVRKEYAATFQILWGQILTSISAPRQGFTVRCCQSDEELSRPSSAGQSSLELQQARPRTTALLALLASTVQSFGAAAVS